MSNDVAKRAKAIGNVIAIIFFVLAGIVVLIGIVTGTFLQMLVSALLMVFAGFISSIGFLGLAEIIQLLEDIKYYIRSLPAVGASQSIVPEVGSPAVKSGFVPGNNSGQTDLSSVGSLFHDNSKEEQQKDGLGKMFEKDWM